MIDKLSWVAAYPEILLAVMACVIALVDLGVKSPQRGATHGLTLATLAVVALLLGLAASGGQTIVGFGGMIVSDPMGNWLKCFAAIALMVTLVYGRGYASQRDMLRGGEISRKVRYSSSAAKSGCLSVGSTERSALISEANSSSPFRCT